MQDNPGVENNVAATRKQQGISAAALARAVGVSRQTIYALESGAYVPNTIVSLRLARALDTGVENLFSLSVQTDLTQPASKIVTFIPSAKQFHVGQPIQLCEVAGKPIAVIASSGLPYLPASDGFVSGRARVTLHDIPLHLDHRLLLAGCDPGMAVLARHLQPFGIELLLLHQNSSESLALLKKGLVHIAGTHLRDEASGESNIAAVQQRFSGRRSVAVISFAISEEGLLTATGNPKQIKSIQDLTRKDVTFVNRELGSGSRRLLDTNLNKLNLEPSTILGYSRTATGHLAAAMEITAGTVDCCLATQAAARMFGLDFISIESVRYDLVIEEQHLNLPAIQTVLDSMSRASFRHKLEGYGGYDTRVTGARVM